MVARVVVKCTVFLSLWFMIVCGLVHPSGCFAAERADDPARPRLVVQLGHTSWVLSVAVSADGRYALSGDAGKTIKLWEVSTGKEIRTFKGHADIVSALTFSPDGAYALSGSADKTVKLWEVATGRQIMSFEGHTGEVTSVAFSRDGLFAVSGSRDKTVRVWEVKSGRAMRVLAGHASIVNAVGISADGKYLLSGSRNGSAQLWDMATGKEIRSFRSESLSISAVFFSPDQKSLATSSGDVLNVWDIASGRRLRSINIPGLTVLSPDWKQAVSVIDAVRAKSESKVIDSVLQFDIVCSYEKPALVLWDVATGKVVKHFEGHQGNVSAITFSPDGSFVLSGSYDRSVKLWNVSGDTRARTLGGNSSPVNFVLFNQKDNYPISGNAGRKFTLWRGVADGRTETLSEKDNLCSAVVIDAMPANSLFSGRMSTDGRHLQTTSYGIVLRYWDIGPAGGETTIKSPKPADIPGFLLPAPGRTEAVAAPPNRRDPVRELMLLNGAISGLSPDGRYFFVKDEHKGNQLILSSTESGQEKGRVEGSFLDFSPDCRHILTAYGDKTIRLWEIEGGRQVGTFKGTWGRFTPAGRILSRDADDLLTLYRAEDGREAGSFPGRFAGISNDGGFAVTSGKDGFKRLWHTDSVTEKGSFKGDYLAFSPDGTHVLTRGDGDGMKLWETAGGREVGIFRGHADTVTSAVFTPDGNYIYSGSSDGTTMLWEVATGRWLARLVSFDDGSWAVLDPEGRYDASNGGDIQGLHWMVGNTPIELSQLKERYYEPGLLAKIVGYNKEPVRDVALLSSPGLFPEVALSQPGADATRLTIDLKNRGGGIGRVRVLVNGKEIVADARGPVPDPAAKESRLSVDLSGAALIPGEQNKVEVFAWNAEGYLSSRGRVLMLKPPAAKTVEPPEMYALVVGISHYANPAMNLAFSGKDAADMAQALQISAKRLFGVEKVHLSLFTDYDQAGRAQDDAISGRENLAALLPSRKNLEKAFREARNSKPTDILVVYLAGHGVMTAGEGADYHYLTREARSTELADPAVRRQVSVSSTELTEWIKAIPALKQVMILDTCAAGGAAVKLMEKRSLSSDQIRSLERLKDRTGFHILMGAAADKVSLEASQYGQGLLTYAILEGMKGASLSEGKFVDVQQLFHYAANRVPDLARSLGGIQRPEVASPGGEPFEIGMVTAEDKDRIPLARVKPLVLRSNFTTMARPVDNLGLTRLVNAELRDFSSMTRGGKLVYVDADELPGAYTLSGRYGRSGQGLKVEAYLFEGEKEYAHFEVEGKETDLPALAKSLVAEAMQKIAGMTVETVIRPPALL